MSSGRVLIGKRRIGGSGSWRGIGEQLQRAFRLHDVLQVTVLPFMQALQTSTH
jgi:hypothetical protein